MAKAKRSAKAHAEGRIVNNGHSGVPSQDASGSVEGSEDLGAGTPEDSRNVSGDVSTLGDGLATAESKSRKGSLRKSSRKSDSQSRRKVLARALSGEFSAAKNFVEETPLTGSTDGEAGRADDEADEELPFSVIWRTWILVQNRAGSQRFSTSPAKLSPAGWRSTAAARHYKL